MNLDIARCYSLQFCLQRRTPLVNLPQLSIQKNALSHENYLVLSIYPRPSLVLNNNHQILLYNDHCNIFELWVLLPIAHKMSSEQEHFFDSSDAQWYNAFHRSFFSQSLPALMIQTCKISGQESSPFNSELAIEHSSWPRHSFGAVLQPHTVPNLAGKKKKKKES